jgi:hypothetical protein
MVNSENVGDVMVESACVRVEVMTEGCFLAKSIMLQIRISNPRSDLFLDRSKGCSEELSVTFNLYSFQKSSLTRIETARFPTSAKSYTL